MTWNTYYRGTGEARDVELPDAPPWRTFDVVPEPTFQPPDGLVDAVNAALCLRRPLLLTGAPGSGKSSVAESIAAELRLEPLLRWHITSRSTLVDALYRYDALGRLEATKREEDDDIGGFIELGPLGTALLPSGQQRILLIDEIDKSDIDLPSDLLNVLERGEYDVPELTRHKTESVRVRTWKSESTWEIGKGQVRCDMFPVIVMTSNGERDFPAPFLRRCIRFHMPSPDAGMLAKIVKAHLGPEAALQADELLNTFADDLRNGRNLAVDQLLNAIFLVTRELPADGDHRDRLTKLLLRDLSAT
ncbi:MoxR family ATPase [Streptomyces sp. ID05-26A]|nr:MoxR family ATPase [Streptomyces sp. ID05-26A]